MANQGTSGMHFGVHNVSKFAFFDYILWLFSLKGILFKVVNNLQTDPKTLTRFIMEEEGRDGGTRAELAFILNSIAVASKVSKFGFKIFFYLFCQYAIVFLPIVCYTIFPIPPPTHIQLILSVYFLIGNCKCCAAFWSSQSACHAGIGIERYISMSTCIYLYFSLLRA